MRRVAQLRSARADLEVVALRGNVDTRLAKLADPGERLEAIVLARAGLQRLDMEARADASLELGSFVPAPGQGALALQGRSDDTQTRAAVQAITDAPTYACLRASARSRATSVRAARRRSARARQRRATASC